jgi:predicted nucleic-acid-binding Zn-ribbon protein
MKLDNKCPKCQTPTVFQATPMDYNTSGDWRMYMAANNDPSRKTTVSAAVCQRCGYTELYTDDPDAIL